MLGKILLLVAIAVAVLYVLRARRQLAILAAQIRALRDHAMQPLTYRRVDASDDSPSVAQLAAELDRELAATTHEAQHAGFTMLGDYFEESPVREGGMPMRWFVDARGTTFGWMAPFDVHGARTTVVVLMSHELATQTITSRAPKASALSRPPFVQVQHVALGTTFAETFAKHREVAQLDDDTRGFVPVKTFEQLEREIERMRAKTVAWRESQPADALLDADLRSLLGAQYDRLGPAMRRRLVA